MSAQIVADSGVVNNAPRSLADLPYEIRINILEHLLLPGPECVHLTDDPPWLRFARGREIKCPPIFSTCRRIYKECLRIVYSETRLVIHPDRDLLARLRHHPGRRWVQRIDLALECRSAPEPLLRRMDQPYKHELISFYAPSYLVEKLGRLFPRLDSVRLTICDTTDASSSSLSASPPPPPYSATGSFYPRTSSSTEVYHRYPISWITERQDVSWQNLITHVRYKLDHKFTELRYRDAEDVLRAKFDFVSNPRHLPNLMWLQLFLTTRLSSRGQSAATDGRGPRPNMRAYDTGELIKEGLELSLPLTIVAQIFLRVPYISLHRILTCPDRSNPHLELLAAEQIHSPHLLGIFR